MVDGSFRLGYYRIELGQIQGFVGLDTVHSRQVWFKATYFVS